MTNKISEKKYMIEKKNYSKRIQNLNWKLIYNWYRNVNSEIEIFDGNSNQNFFLYQMQ